MRKIPSITEVFSQDCEKHYDWFVGVGSRSALLADTVKKTLVKYTIDDVQAKKMFEKALPDDIEAYCQKYLLEDGRIVLQDCDYAIDPNRLYSDKLEPLKIIKGDYGYLIGTLTPDLLVYAKKVSLRDYEVDIYSADNNHQRVLTLRPGEGRTWSGGLSVCRHPYTGYLAVVGYNPSYSTLDIYNKKGKCWSLSEV